MLEGTRSATDDTAVIVTSRSEFSQRRSAGNKPRVGLPCPRTSSKGGGSGCPRRVGFAARDAVAFRVRSNQTSQLVVNVQRVLEKAAVVFREAISENI